MIAKLKVALKHGEAKKQEEASRSALDKELEQVRAILDAEAKKAGKEVAKS